jgi:hypothetical protein
MEYKCRQASKQDVNGINNHILETSTIEKLVLRRRLELFAHYLSNVPCLVDGRSKRYWWRCLGVTEPWNTGQ